MEYVKQYLFVSIYLSIMYKVQVQRLNFSLMLLVQAAGPEVPEYNLVNVQMKGYDFTVLEHYGKWVHNTATNMGIDVEDW